MKLIKIYKGTEGRKNEKRKGGSLKRRARMQPEREGKENGGGDQDMCSQSPAHKRGFALQDADELMEDDNPPGKKTKVGEVDLFLPDNSVEVASQNWPHLDQ